jgi:hypothetical protein
LGDILVPERKRRHGFLVQLAGLILLCVAVVYLVAAITSPWAFHIGGRFTPLLYWSGTGKLTTSSGTHTLFLNILPGSEASELRLDGLHPTGGLQGSGWLCTEQGAAQYLIVSGTIFNGWRTTEDSLIEVRLLEQRSIDAAEKRGYFELYGRWQGKELVVNDRGEPGSMFRSGLTVRHASGRLAWTGDWLFGNPCPTTSR